MLSLLLILIICFQTAILVRVLRLEREVDELAKPFIYEPEPKKRGRPPKAKK
jgi:hypothetical protein